VIDYGDTRLNSIETAIEKWKREGVSLLPPLSLEAVAAKLSLLGRPWSRDLLALHAATGGMTDDESDSHLWSLWPLEKVITATTSYNRPYILFADFSINAQLYCLKYENDEQSSVAIDYVNGNEPKTVARSLDEFFQVFNSDAAKLKMFE